MSKKIPSGFNTIFWDVDPNALDIERHRVFIAERIFEYGDEQAINWLLKNFPRFLLRKIVRQSRRLSAKTRNFWKIKL